MNGSTSPALVDFEWTRDSQVGLDVRRAAEFVETGIGTVDIDAIGIVGIGDGDGTGAFHLIDSAQLETAGKVDGACEHEAVTNVFAGWPVVARSESIQQSGVRRSGFIRADAIHVVKQFAQQASPGLRLGERVVRDQVEAAHVALQMQHERRCSWNGCRIRTR